VSDVLTHYKHTLLTIRVFHLSMEFLSWILNVKR